CFSASSRNFCASAKRCLYASPTNFSRSASVKGTPLLEARSDSLRSFSNWSFGVAGLSWALPCAGSNDRCSTRIPLAIRCMGVSPNQLHHRFPRKVGRGINPVLTKLLLECARRILRRELHFALRDAHAEQQTAPSLPHGKPAVIAEQERG